MKRPVQRSLDLFILLNYRRWSFYKNLENQKVKALTIKEKVQAGAQLIWLFSGRYLDSQSADGL